MNVFRTNIHFGLCTTSPDHVSGGTEVSKSAEAVSGSKRLEEGHLGISFRSRFVSNW